MGGISGFDLALPINQNLAWINCFYGAQFIVMFSGSFQKILDEPFDKNVTADGVPSEVIVNKLCIYPFISIQKEFGYSDTTLLNNSSGKVNDLFTNSEDRMKKIFSSKSIN